MTPLRLFPEDESETPQPAQPEPPADLNVATIIQAYLDHRELLVMLGHSADALKDARRYLRAFATSFGQLIPAQCRQQDILRFLALHPEWKSPYSKNDAIKFVVGCFRWAADEDGGNLIDRCRYHRPRGIIEEPEPRKPIRRPDFLGVIRASGYHKTRTAFRALMFFLWRTGARPCEGREVKIEEIDWDRGVIEKVKHKTKKKSGSRLIPINGIRRLVRAAIGNRTSGTIFLNGRGRAWTRSNLSDIFRSYADRAGISKELSAYCARHGFITEGVELGIGDRQLAQVSGHKDVRRIETYSKTSRRNADHINSVAAQVNRHKPEHI